MIKILNEGADFADENCMTIEACPHCYRRVIAMADGACPACGRNTTDVRGVDLNRVLVSVRGRDLLPNVCHECGVATGGRKLVHAVSEPQGTTMAAGIGGLMRFVFKPLFILDRLERYSKQVEVSVELPTCGECARKVRKVKPKYIDFEDGRIDLVVHVDFRKAMEKQELDL